MSDNIQEDLKAPFTEYDIDWRIGRAGQIESTNQVWATCLPYVTSRAIQDRLDSVLGIDGWHDHYEPGPDGGVKCVLSCLINDKWITKEDGASNTQIEAIKGGYSDALKRAAVKFGIGRYLYRIGTMYADILPPGQRGAYKQGANSKKGIRAFNWNPPKLPDWAVRLDDAEKNRRDKDNLDKAKGIFNGTVMATDDQRQKLASLSVDLAVAKRATKAAQIDGELTNPHLTRDRAEELIYKAEEFLEQLDKARSDGK